jgi:flagella basal body P-ring formation protein FlgA
LSIKLKVVALEDGAPGQLIKLRNPASARYLSGRVLDDQTVLISL